MASSHIDIPIRLEGEDLRQCLQAVVARSELIEKGYVTGTQRALARFQRDGLLDGGTVPTRAPDSAEEEGNQDWRTILPRLRALEEQLFGPDHPLDEASSIPRDPRAPSPSATRPAALPPRDPPAPSSVARSGRSRSPRR